MKINGETHYLWRAVDHKDGVLESFATKRRNRNAALKLVKKSIKRFGQPHVVVTDNLRPYGAAMKAIGDAQKQEIGRWLNNLGENSLQPFRRGEQAVSGFRRMEN